MVDRRAEQAAASSALDDHADVRGHPVELDRELERLRAELRRREQELAIIVDNAPIGMSIVDAGDHMTRVNDALCRFLGRTEAELLERTWKELTHPDDLAIGATEIAELFAGERSSLSVEKRYLRGDGEAVWAQVNVALLRDEAGTPLYRVTQHVDITDRKERELRLERIAAAERAVAEELRRLHDLKSAVLDAVSHELRTPLTVIRGMAETLQTLHGHLEPPVRLELEDALVGQTRRLSDLLDDLLELERLGRGGSSLEIEVVDVTEVVRGTIANSAVAARTQLEAPTPLLVRTDERRIRLILDNLLNNAEKYAPLAPVTVRLTTLAEGGLRLDVIDQGPGIAPAEREAVFEPFHRATADHPRPGTGIGLSLVARFAALHGGGAWVEDSPIGTHLVVTLPEPPR